MIIKLLLKIWPAITPILIYSLWLLAKGIARKIIMRSLDKKANKIIDGVFEEVNKEQKGDVKEEKVIGDFSLENRQFILVLYVSIFIAIICFLFFALNSPKIAEGQYVPAHIENGKIMPARIIEK
ncbi:MAG: hypothetical protein ACJA0S_000971 [Rickettsiales bacterium]|jgi:hypothetical protein